MGREDDLKNANIYKSFFDLFPDPVVQFSADFKLLKINKAFCDYLGFQEHELLKKSLVHLLDKDDISELKNILKEFKQKKIDREIILHLTHKSGTQQISVFKIKNIQNNQPTPNSFVGFIIHYKHKNLDNSILEGIDNNFTQSEKVVEELERVKNLFKGAQKLAGIGYFDVDMITHTDWWSDELYDILLMDPKNTDPSLEKILEFVHPDDKANFKERINRCIQNEDNANIEYRCLRTDNSIVYLREQIEIFRDSSGKPIRMIGIVQDISMQKINQQALKESEEKYRTLVESATDGIAIVQQGIMQYVNPELLKFSDYTNEELVGKPFINFIAPEEKQKVINIHKERMMGDTKVYNYETRLCLKENKLIDIEVTSTLLKYKGNNAALVFIRDISEKKKAEEQLALMRFGIDHSQIGIYMADENGVITYVNDYACKSLGYSAEELIKLKLEKIDPNYNSKSRIKRRYNNTTRSSWTIETWHKRKDGTEFPVEITINYIEFNKKLFTISFLKNITDRQKAQEALKQQNTEYQLLNEKYLRQNQELIQSLDHIKSINTELKEAKIRAEESDRLKSAFIANMSHEIRTPMNGIIGFSNMYTKPDLNAEKRDYYAKIVIDSCNRLLRIVNDVLDISRIETGQVQVKSEEVNVNDLIMELFVFYKSNTEHHRVSFYPYKALKDEDSIIFTDKTKLFQIMNNLLSNAFKFTESGHIKYGYELKDNELIFYVKDTGIGIPSDQKKFIFQPFRQADMGFTRQYGGTGLGLAISKKLVELLGGNIWFESEEAKGSVFYFTMPYNQLKISGNLTPLKKQGKEKSGTKLKILIAEDEEVNYLFLEEILLKFNSRIYHAKDGKEAVDIFKKNPDIQIILMDIKMPVMDGYKALKIIKKISPETIVIAQTAYAMTEDRKKALSAGCDDYIAKPINKDELVLLFIKYADKLVKK
ncbi:MAG: PAS domain S-box protein [Bacteroidales bacterium]|nr:PAS domain S-box protein [Bacteroidales bacterium]